MPERDPRLSAQNREMFRAFAPQGVWQQMAQYGMDRGSSFPGTGDIPHQPGDSEFLVMMLEAFREQEEKKRKLAGKEYKSPTGGDPLLDKARLLSGG